MWADVPPGETTGSTCARLLKLHLAAKLAPCSKEAADAVGAEARAARSAAPHARSNATTTEAGKRMVFLISMHLPPYLGDGERNVLASAPACYCSLSIEAKEDADYMPGDH